jgi:hypothetical protein
VVDEATAEKDADVDKAVRDLLTMADQLRDTAMRIDAYASARRRRNTGDQPSTGEP